jgi:hypothetical protein
MAIVLQAAGVEYSFSNEEEIWLGRSDTCNVCFSNPHVSRRHGRLVQAADGWRYEDTGSKHGTRYRGRPIRQLRLDKPVTLLLGEPGRGEEVHIRPQYPSRIFICYRREDTAGHAGRLRDRLAEVFGDSQVFLDTEHVGIGEDFVDRTTRVVGSCRAVLVVIGQRWLSVVDAQGRRRLDDEDDYVRLEIATALRRAPPTAVIPVLVHGARMPTEEELPVDLRALSRRNALVAPDERWRPEVDRLIERLETIMRDPEEHPGSSVPSAPPAGGPTGPDDARA